MGASASRQNRVTTDGSLPRSSAAIAVLGFAYVLSGAGGLVSEQVFEKMLTTVVGASTPASAIVLAVYFAGLTAGGLLAVRVLAAVRRPLRVYGWLEAAVGGWCVLLAIGLAPIQRVSAVAIQLAGESQPWTFMLRLVVAAAWILPPTIAMGMSFPVVVAGVQQIGPPQPRRSITRLYALNLVGAVLAAVAAPYLVFPVLGLGGALALVGVAEVVVLGLAITADRTASEGVVRRVGAGAHSIPVTASLRLPIALLGVAFASGFVVFGLEVVWVHLTGAVLGCSVYAFAIMLAVTLASLAVGGGIASRLGRRAAAVPAHALAVALALAALVLAWTSRGWDDVPGFLGHWGSSMTSFGEGELLRFVVAIAIIGPTATLLGVVYPILFRLQWFPVERAGTAAGWVSAVNAVGCISGALVTGFWLLPLIGAEALIGVMTALLLALSWGVMWTELRRRDAVRRGARRPATLVVVVVTLVVAATARFGSPWDLLHLTSGINVYFRPFHVADVSRLLFWHEDTAGGFTTVVANPEVGGGEVKVLLTNGKFQGNDGGERAAQVGFALIPIIHQPARGRALVIGLGTGHSAAVVRAAGFGELDVAELAPGIVAAAREWFGQLNRQVLDQPRVRLHLEDGRNYLLRTDARFDLVTIEISSIWFAGSTNLYSREFYELVRTRLTDQGVLQQWIQLHHIAPVEVAAVVATLRDVFGHVTLWHIGGQALLVASPAPLVVSQAVIDQLEASTALRSELELLARSEGVTLGSIERWRLLDEAGATNLSRHAARLGIPVNTDRNRYLEFATPRHNLERRDHAAEVIEFLATLAAHD